MDLLITSEYGGIGIEADNSQRPIFFKEKFGSEVPLQELLDFHFTAKVYGEGLKSYYFVHRIYLPSWQAKEKIFYKPRSKHFIYSSAMETEEDFEFYKTCSLLEWQQLMAKNFLIGIEKMGTFPVKKFDYNSFHQDVELLFKREGFIA
jgi:hypothetical protein